MMFDATTLEGTKAKPESIQGRANNPFGMEVSAGFGTPEMLTGGLNIFIQQAADQIIPWSYYPYRRDRQLRMFARVEPIVSGALYSMSSRIAALPYQVTGKAAPQKFYSDVVGTADLGAGPMQLFQKTAYDLWTQDNGAFWEKVGAGDPDKPLVGPVVQVNHMDSARCWRTFDPDFPVIYYNPYTAAFHKMHKTRVVMMSDNTQPDELALNMGFCAMSRALRAIQIARSINTYKNEKLSGNFTRALLMLQGVTPKQVKTAQQQTEDDQASQGFLRFMNIPTIASMTEVDFKLIDFASLPDGYDELNSTNLYVYTLALDFGIDAREFWPATSGGATKADASVQHMKSQGKGVANIIQIIEHAWNWQVMNKTGAEFTFEQQDNDQDLQVAQIHKTQADTIVELVKAGILTPEQGQAIAIALDIVDDTVIASVAAVKPVDENAPAATQQQNVQPGQTPGNNTPPGGNQPPANTPPGAAAKGLDSDGQRKWFFANNPQMAISGSMPRVRSIDGDEQVRQKLEHFAENSQHPVATHLWSKDMVEYHPSGKLVVNPENTKAAAAALMRDTRDAQMPRDWTRGAYRDLNHAEGDDKTIEAGINTDKANEAKAVLLASHVGNVKLTDAQHNYMTDVAKGKYLDRKYGQYTSGDNGTLLGPRSGSPRLPRNRDGFQSAAAADLQAMHYGFVNGKEVSSKAAAPCYILMSLADDPALTTIQNDLKAQMPDAEWADPSTFHITLVYAVDAKTKNLQDIKTVLPKSINPFTFSTIGLSTFDPKDGQKPIVLKVKAPDSLIALQSGLYASFEALGLTLSDYSKPDAWVPHITLAYAPADAKLPSYKSKIDLTSNTLTCSISSGDSFDVAYVTKAKLMAAPITGDEIEAARRELKRIGINVADLRRREHAK